MDTQTNLESLETFDERLHYLVALFNKAATVNLTVSSSNVQVNTAIKRQLLLPAQTLIQGMMQDITKANQIASQSSQKSSLELDL